MSRKIAVAVMSWTRPHYFQQALDSYSLGGVDDADLWVFQDGGTTAEEQEAVAECVAIASKYEHPRKTIVRADKNIGCGLNYHKAFKLLDLDDYDYLFVLSDDEVLAEDFVSTGIALQRRVESFVGVAVTQQYSGVGQHSDVASQKKILQDPARAVTGCFGGHWIGFCMSSGLWDLIREPMTEYHDHYMVPFSDTPYPYTKALSGEARKILGAWFMREFGEVPGALGVDGALETITKSLCTHPPRFTLNLPRLKNIGEVGIHSNAAVYARLNLGKARIADLSASSIMDTISRWQYSSET